MPSKFSYFVFVVTVASVTLLTQFSVVNARDVFVNNRSGDDTRFGYNADSISDSTGPVRTIKRAIEIARNGDRVVLEPNDTPYNETIVLTRYNNSGSRELPFIIEGNGAVIDGTRPLPDGVWEYAGDNLFRFTPPIRTTDFTYFQIYDKLGEITFIKSQYGKTMPQLSPREWTLYNGKVFFMAEDGKTPLKQSDYNFVYTHFTSGVTLLQVANVRIHDLTVQGFQIDGISAFNNTDVVLDNVTCSNNGRAGLTVANASKVAAGFCTFKGNVETDVQMLPNSKAHLYACDIERTSGEPEQMVTEDSEDGSKGAAAVMRNKEVKQNLLPMPKSKQRTQSTPKPSQTKPKNQTTVDENDDPFDL
ncbi:MAG: right-handed parallel beta-helix repeat-containing protein [Planctomycetaceae bacterium]|jgi:hypothetical protein|nr:right-handed parallel beta-helix repeat-containing protein [Planctomycetaceae bacterium]